MFRSKNETRYIYIFTERKRGRSSLSKVFRPLCLFSYAVTVSRKSGPSPLLYFYGGRKLVGIFPPKVSLRKDEARNNNTTGTASLSFTFARRKLVGEGNLSAVVPRYLNTFVFFKKEEEGDFNHLYFEKYLPIK